ncbi:hypothetical protein GGI15_004901 [Coemansia interrupta]|uniref:Uncharacterized protein n=1 Tax=Coemansia interrupta TaxID=1126814 RepID=A0A9W8LCT2_9FUNG|nr:hypothetical protein GGI15_004901 [Coemansia interrupta]
MAEPQRRVGSGALGIVPGTDPGTVGVGIDWLRSPGEGTVVDGTDQMQARGLSLS